MLITTPSVTVRSLLLLALTTLLPFAAADAFLGDVFINNASQPSLTFGQGCTNDDVIFPAPPFSAMFGVADTFLVNRTPDADPVLRRLSQDCTHVITPGNRWVIAAGLFTRTLTFAPRPGFGDFPGSLSIVWRGQNNELTAMPLAAGQTLAAEPGKSYTIAYAPAPADPLTLFHDHDHDTLAIDRNALPLSAGKTLTLNAETSTLTLDFVSLANYPSPPDVDTKGTPTWTISAVTADSLPALSLSDDVNDAAIKRVTASFNPPLAAGATVTLNLTAANTTALPVAATIRTEPATPPAPLRQLVWLVDQTAGNFSFATLPDTRITFRENTYSTVHPLELTATDSTLFTARLRASAAADWQNTTAVAFAAATLNDPAAGSVAISADGRILLSPANGYAGIFTITYTARQTISPFAEQTGTITVDISENKLFQVIGGKIFTAKEGKYTLLKPLVLKPGNSKLFECQTRSDENAPWKKYSKAVFTAVDTIPADCGLATLTDKGTISFFPAPNWNGTVDLHATLAMPDTGLSASGILTIVMTPVNTLPVLAELESISTDEGAPVLFSCLISDNDDDEPIIDATSIKLGSFSGFVEQSRLQTGPTSWRFLFASTAPLPHTSVKHPKASIDAKLSFKVGDGRGKTASIKTTLPLFDVDLPPALKSLTVNKKKDQQTFYAAVNESFTAAAKIADPDKDKAIGITYRWRREATPNRPETIHVGETLPAGIATRGDIWRLELDVLTAPYKAAIISDTLATDIVIRFDRNTPPRFLDDPADKLHIPFAGQPATLEFNLPLDDAERDDLLVTLAAEPAKGTASLNGRKLVYAVTDPTRPFAQDDADTLTIRVSDGELAVQKTYQITYCVNTPPQIAPLEPVLIAEVKGKKAGSFTVKASASDSSTGGEASGIAAIFCQVLDQNRQPLETWLLPPGKSFRNTTKASFSGKITLPGFDTITGPDRPAESHDFTLVVTAVDALGARTSAESTITVQDSDAIPDKPVGVNFIPPVPHHGDILRAEPVPPLADRDGDPIDHRFIWTSSARRGESWEGPTLETTIRKGEKWTCTVYHVTRPPYRPQPYPLTDKKLVPAKAFTVAVANTPPTGGDQALSIPANVSSDLLISGIHDADPDDTDKLTLKIVDKPKAGKTKKISGLVIPYTPTPGYTGIDTFTYEIRDRSRGVSPVYTVTLFIGVAAPPEAAPGAAPTCGESFSAPALTAGSVQLPWYPEVTLTVPGYAREALLVRILAGAEVVMETLVPRGDAGAYTLTAAAYYQAGCAGLRPGATHVVKGYSWSDETGIGMEKVELPLSVSDYAAPAEAAIDILAPAEGEPFHAILLDVPGASAYTLALERDGAPWLRLERDVRPGDGLPGHDRLDLALPAGFYALSLVSRNPAGAMAEPLELDCLSIGTTVEPGQWPENGFYPTGAVQSATLALPPFSWPALADAVGYRLQICGPDGVVLYEGVTTATSGIPVALAQPLPPGSFWQVTAYDAEGGSSISRPLPIE